MEVGFIRWHSKSPKEGTSGGTFVFAGPFWGELEALREARAAVAPPGPDTKIRDAAPRGSEALVALLSLSVQRGYKPPAYMWCKYGRQAMGMLLGGEDLEAAFEKAREDYTGAWIAVMDAIRSGVEMRILIRWRSQFSEHDVVDVEYVRALMDKYTSTHQHEDGDVIVLDNFRVGHARNPWDGSRRELYAAWTA